MPPPVTLKIKFKSTSISQFAERYSTDVSASGIFIRAKEPLPLGTHLRFEFQLADGVAILDGEGTVVWRREHDPARTGVAAGMGVRFDRIGAGSQQALDQILTEKARRGEGGVESRFDAGIRDAQAISGHAASPPVEMATPLAVRPPAADEWLESDESTRVMAAEQSRQLAEKTRGPDAAGRHSAATGSTDGRPLPGDSWSQQATIADAGITATLAARTIPSHATHPGPAAAAAPSPGTSPSDTPRPPGTLRAPPPPPRPKSARQPAVSAETPSAAPTVEARQFTPAVVTAIPAEDQTLPDASAFHTALPTSRPEATPAPAPAPAPMLTATPPPTELPQPAAAPPIAPTAPITPITPRRSWRRAPLVFAGLILAIAAAFLLLRSESQPVTKIPPPATPKPPPTQLPAPSTAAKAGVEVAVTSTPAGASLTVDGRPIEGTTPTRLVDLDPAKSYQVTARLPGYLPQSVKLTPTAGVPLALPLVEAERFIELTSLPAGAEVQVDGKRVGKTGATPLSVKVARSPTGHQVTLSLPGFAAEARTITDRDDFALRDGREVLVVAATLTPNTAKPLAAPGPVKRPAPTTPPAALPNRPPPTPGAVKGEPIKAAAPKPVEAKPATPAETPKAAPLPGGEAAPTEDKTNIKVPSWMKQPPAEPAK